MIKNKSKYGIFYSFHLRLPSLNISNSEYLVRNRVQAANQQDLLVKGVKCLLYKACSVYCTSVQCVMYKCALCIVQGGQYVLYKVCSVYYTGCAV